MEDMFVLETDEDEPITRHPRRNSTSVDGPSYDVDGPMDHVHVPDVDGPVVDVLDSFLGTTSELPSIVEYDTTFIGNRVPKKMAGFAFSSMEAWSLL